MAKDRPLKPVAPLAGTTPRLPQSDDPVEMASEMSFPASDPPASRVPTGADAGLPHDKLEGHDASVSPRRPGDDDPSVLRPTEPPPT